MVDDDAREICSRSPWQHYQNLQSNRHALLRVVLSTLFFVVVVPFLVFLCLFESYFAILRLQHVSHARFGDAKHQRVEGEFPHSILIQSRCVQAVSFPFIPVVTFLCQLECSCIMHQVKPCWKESRKHHKGCKQAEFSAHKTLVTIANCFMNTDRDANTDLGPKQPNQEVFFCLATALYKSFSKEATTFISLQSWIPFQSAEI